MKTKIKNKTIMNTILRRGKIALLFLMIAGLAVSLYWAEQKAVVASSYEVSITEFGAVPNDNGDDVNAIQQALNSVPETGGTVKVPAGVFHISKTINFHKSKITLTGVGQESVIKFLPNVLGAMLEMPQLGLPGNPYNLITPQDNTITKLRFDGNKNHDPRPWLPETSVFGLLIRQSERLTISEVTVHDIAEDGIAIGNGQLINKDLVVKDSHVYRIGRNGIHLGQGDNLRVSRVHIEDTPSQQWGPASGNSIDFEVEGTYPNIYVRNAIIEDSILERANTTTAGDGVALQPAYGPIDGALLRNNFIRNFQFGWNINATAPEVNPNGLVKNVTVENNIIHTTDDFAVGGGAMGSVNAVNLKIHNNTAVNAIGNYHFGAYINNGRPGTEVTGNTFLIKNGCGVRLNNSNGVTITNNKYTDCEIQHVQPNTGTIISGNTKLPYSAVDVTNPIAYFNLQSGQTIANNAIIPLTANDTGVGLFKVFYFFDGIPIGSSNSSQSSFAVDFSKYTVGAHTLSVLAIDKHGNTSEKSQANITIGSNGSATVTSVAALPNNTPVPPANGLVGYWKFNEGSGTTVADSSPNGINGTLSVGSQGDQTQVAQAWANGDSPTGGGLYFDKTDDVLKIPNHPSFNPNSGDYSIAFWLKFMGDCSTVSLFPIWKEYAVDFNIGPNYGCKLNARINGGGHYVTSQNLNLGWSHFALTMSRSGNMILYQNGVKVGERSSAGLPASIGNNAPLTLGYLMDGALDELVIYNRALSASEVASLTSLQGSQPTPTPTPTPTLTPTPTPTVTPTPTATPTPTNRTNVALAANGGTASASSFYNNSYAPSGAINGDRKGANWGNGGGWNDATSSYPDWLQVDFSGSKNIDEINVFTVQDNYPNPTEPTETSTFTQYGITNFTVQYWNGSSWITVPGGSVTNNNKVWSKFTFAPVTTTKIRVSVNNALGNYSRITELEAWGSSNGGGTTTPTPTPTPPTNKTNVASAANGGVASASSFYNNSYAPSGAINGDRKGANWGNNGGWNDASAGNYPDWLQVDFNGGKTIDEINVFTVQDNYTNPVELTESSTFTQYGITNFTVQYWTGSAWTAVPNGTVTNSNKVWSKFVFAPVTTTKIRVSVNNALANYSRITELEAWGNSNSGGTTTPTPTPTPPSTVIADGTYKLIAECSGKALDVSGISTADGADVIQWTPNGGANQSWRVERQADGYYRLTASHSGKALDVLAAAGNDGADVVQWSPYGGANQQWQIVAVGNGYYKLLPRHAPGKALEVAGSSAADGANVHIWADNGSSGQRWQFILTN